LKLDHSKEFQLDAITSTLSLFEGQIKPEESFVDYVDGVVPNMLTISKEEILKNLKSIQKQNSLPISEKLNGMDFSIEMETGTGKTYVYLRTIYELNEKYGFKKYIILKMQKKIFLYCTIMYPLNLKNLDQPNYLMLDNFVEITK